MYWKLQFVASKLLFFLLGFVSNIFSEFWNTGECKNRYQFEYQEPRASAENFPARAQRKHKPKISKKIPKNSTI